MKWNMNLWNENGKPIRRTGQRVGKEKLVLSLPSRNAAHKEGWSVGEEFLGVDMVYRQKKKSNQKQLGKQMPLSGHSLAK